MRDVLDRYEHHGITPNEEQMHLFRDEIHALHRRVEELKRRWRLECVDVEVETDVEGEFIQGRRRNWGPCWERGEGDRTGQQQGNGDFERSTDFHRGLCTSRLFKEFAYFSSDRALSSSRPFTEFAYFSQTAHFPDRALSPNSRTFQTAHFPDRALFTEFAYFSQTAHFPPNSRTFQTAHFSDSRTFTEFAYFSDRALSNRALSPNSRTFQDRALSSSRPFTDFAYF